MKNYNDNSDDNALLKRCVLIFLMLGPKTLIDCKP